MERGRGRRGRGEGVRKEREGWMRKGGYEGEGSSKKEENNKVSCPP